MKQFFKILLLLTTLSQTIQAGRYYDSDYGRFVSRDPIGYVDGMSLYNAYFAERFASDPTGFLREMTEQDFSVVYGTTQGQRSLAETDPHQLMPEEIEIDRAWWATQGCDWEIEVEPQGVTITVNKKRYTQRNNNFYDSNGVAWDAPGTGSGSNNPHPDVRNISTKDHELLHAKNWMNIYNSQFVPMVNSHEDKYYDTYNDAVKAKKRIKAFYDFLYYFFHLREALVTHPHLGQNVSNSDLNTYQTRFQTYAEEMINVYNNTENINSYYHPNDPRSGYQGVGEATGEFP